MVIQHNMLAANAQRMLNVNTRDRAKVSEKLSSGYRVNRAADDAAGLAISEKMRRQIRGLTQASLNAQDGISMVQIAEGALNEVHDMLQRMNELCVKAANDTLTYDDRDYIQQEIDQISDEINRVGAVTEFNEIRVLNGIPQTSTTAVSPGITVNGAAGSIAQASGDRDATYTINEIQRGDVVFIPGSEGTSSKYYQAATREDINAYEQEWRDYYSAKSTYDSEKRAYDAELTRYEEAKRRYEEGLSTENPGDPPTAPTPPVQPLRRDGSSSGKGQLIESTDLNRLILSKIVNDNLEANTDIAESMSATAQTSGGKTKYDLLFFGPLTTTLQVGSEAEDEFTFKISTINAASLGLYNINVKDNDGQGARDGIDIVKSAIVRTSEERSKLGAVQNRLEHTVRNLDNVVENTSAAESRIRDTDMAKMISELSNKDIILQAGQMMLAQANQTNQGVLSLLQ